MMANRNDRNRNAKRARKTAEVDLTTYERPIADCVEETYPYDLDDADFRIVLRTVRHNKRLVEFAIVLYRLYGDDSSEVYSIDSQHGYLHEHIHGHSKPQDRRDIKPLFSQVDVQESFDEPALQMVIDRYKRLRG